MKKVALVFALGLTALISVDCGGTLFPKCDDPKNPCPPVDPNYPPPAPFAAPRDAGTG